MPLQATHRGGVGCGNHLFQPPGCRRVIGDGCRSAREGAGRKRPNAAAGRPRQSVAAPAARALARDLPLKQMMWPKWWVAQGRKGRPDVRTFLRYPAQFKHQLVLPPTPSLLSRDDHISAAHILFLSPPQPAWSRSVALYHCQQGHTTTIRAKIKASQGRQFEQK